LAEYFALGEVAAREFSVEKVWGDELGRVDPAQPEETLWACLGVLPMGWTWILYFCYSALTHAMVASEAAPRGISEELAATQVLRDRAIAPRVLRGRRVLAPYVDDGLIIGFDKDDAVEAEDALCQELEKRGLLYKVEWEGRREMEALGVWFQGTT
jgi:hypothetical protein